MTIGGLILLMIAVLNANRMLVNTDVEPANSENQTNIAASAEDLLAEIKSKKFDQNAQDSVVLIPSQFTSSHPTNFLGPEAGTERDSCVLPDSGDYRSLYRYNDIDDYNGYVRIDTTSMMTGFRDSVVVYYVSESNPDTKVNTQTFFKRIDITVTHPSMKKPLKLSDVAVYRKFF